MDIVVGLFAILLAAVIGFAVHRASLCNVKAVAELLTSKRAHMLGSFLKTMLWVIAVTFVIDFYFHPVSERPLIFWAFSPLALLGGVLLSSLTNKRFALDPRFRLDWLLNLLGGFLMGFGVTLAPGGNDVLILHSIPGGSPHALPAYGALLVGTAAGLIVIRMLGGTAVRIECTGDICRTQPVPKK